MKKVEYKRKKDVELFKYNIKFNKDNNWTVEVEDKYMDKVLLNPDFVIVGSEKTKKERKSVSKALKGGD